MGWGRYEYGCEISQDVGGGSMEMRWRYENGCGVGSMSLEVEEGEVNMGMGWSCDSVGCLSDE